MAPRRGGVLAGLLLALLGARPALGEVTADLVLSARYWRTDARHQARLDNIRMVADAAGRAPLAAHLDYDRQGGVDEALAEAYGEWRAGRLRSRLGREEIALEHDPAERLEGVALDGEAVSLPPGDPPAPSDVLSDELERFTPDPVYEAAVLAAVA